MESSLQTIAAEKSEIDKIIKQFFDVFNNTGQNQPDWTILAQICIPETLIIKKTGITETTYDLNSFIEPRKVILTNGTFLDFSEEELEEETKIIGNIAQRHSRYQKSGTLNNNTFLERGTKLFQLIKTDIGWKISSLVWEDDL